MQKGVDNTTTFTITTATISHFITTFNARILRRTKKIYYARCKKHIHAFGNKQGFEKLFLARKDLYVTKHYKHFVNCKYHMEILLYDITFHSIKDVSRI